MSRIALAVALLAAVILGVHVQADPPVEQPRAAPDADPGTERVESPRRVGAPECQRVAVIDMAHVFKNYSKFIRLRDELKSRIETADQEGQQRTADIQQMQEQLKGGAFEAGSDAYVELESEIAKATAEFEVWRKTAQQRFQREEASLYKSIYLEVSDAVQAHARHQGFALVLRFSRSNREELEQSADPKKILESLNNMAIYWQPELDITDAILEQLNRQDRVAGLTRGAGTGSD